jgi:hypothetical protein
MLKKISPIEEREAENNEKWGCKITTHFEFLEKKMGDQRQPSKLDGWTEIPFFGVE